MEYGIFQNFASSRYFFNFWIMEYAKNNGNKKKKIKSVEYGIFAEYSQKIVKQSKYPKFWNMEYSMEYSWNIPKIVKQAMGA